MKFEDLYAPHHLEENATLTAEAVMSGSALLYPFKDIDKAAVSLASVRAWRVDNAANGHHHNVVLACRKLDGNNDYAVWCGDGFLEGSMKKETPEERIAAALASHTSLAPGTVSALKAAAGVLSTMKSDGCNFWSLHKTGKLCKHCMHVLATSVNQVVADGLAEFLDVAIDDGPASGVPETAPSVDWRDRLPFAVPVLLQGDRGSGKTHEVFAFARERSVPLVLMAGHEGIQAIDMLGHLVPYGTATLVWKDGPLAEAFRRASSEKVVLLIDEILRVPQRELSILLTALSPIEGHYQLPTGRMVEVTDGVGSQEVLRCPVSNLAVFATTNVGGQYAVDEIDPAIAERFVVFQKDTEEAVLRAILQGVVDARRWKKKAVDGLIKFYRELNALVAAGSLNRGPTTRTLVRAVELATSETELALTIQWQSLLWVDLDSRGKPDAEQVRVVNAAIEECFKKKGGKRGSGT